MRLKRWIDFAIAALQVRLGLGRRPIFLSWPITNRCNRRCLYCGRPDQAGEELQTRRAAEIVDELAAVGTRFIFLSGGEPLMRNDIGSIIARCRSHGMFVCLTTNGSLYLDRKKEIGRVDMIKISLDGAEPLHDRYRGSGSFQEVRRVLADAESDRIPVMLNPVITSANIDQIDEILAIAIEHHAVVKFQPVNRGPAAGRDIAHLELSSENLQLLSRRLRHRRNSTTAVANTAAGLEYLGTLPAGRRMRCYAGRLFAYLLPNGDLFPCNKRDEIASPVSCRDLPVADALRRLPSVGCNECWCTSDAELNLAMRFSPRTIADLASRILRIRMI